MFGEGFGVVWKVLILDWSWESSCGVKFVDVDEEGEGWVWLGFIVGFWVEKGRTIEKIGGGEKGIIPLFLRSASLL